jgi:signal transduction histidine kinase
LRRDSARKAGDNQKKNEAAMNIRVRCPGHESRDSNSTRTAAVKFSDELLNSCDGWVSGGDPLVAGRAYAIMERQLFHLVRLTDDLLDVSRITRNKIELRRERIDLRLVLQSAIETTQPLIAVAGQILTADIPRDAVWVYADFTRLAQAVSNLMNNAVKYTPRGGGSLCGRRSRTAMS